MPSTEERGRLLKDDIPRYSGFKVHPAQRLAVQKKPCTMLHIECKHFFRKEAGVVLDEDHSLPEYKLWMEAGNCYQSPFLQRPSPDCDSNIWRNFNRQYGIFPRNKNVSKLEALAYPLNMPPPSRLGQNTHQKFISETRLFVNERFRAIAAKRAKEDLLHSQQLKLMSESRDPPLDHKGKAKPPENYRRYKARTVFQHEDELPNPYRALLEPRDMFGKLLQKSKNPTLVKKLIYKLNTPKYEEMREKFKEKYFT